MLHHWAETAYIYIRGEFWLGAQVLERAINEARQSGYLGSNVLASGRPSTSMCTVALALIFAEKKQHCWNPWKVNAASLGLNPRFLRTHGLYQKPTVVNNVETLANIPHIINRGAEWFASIGMPPKSSGTRIFCLSGHVKSPGNYEIPMGVTFREMIYEIGGGMRGEKPLKAFIPGGASAPFLTPDHLDVKMDFESVAMAGSMLGSGGITVMEEGTSMVWAALRLMEFFYHESCGKCTPCREGSSWLVQTLQRIWRREGQLSDLDLLTDLCKSIEGRTVCAFGDAEFLRL